MDIDTVEWVFGFCAFEDDLSERQAELLGLQFSFHLKLKFKGVTFYRSLMSRGENYILGDDISPSQNDIRAQDL